ncbi:MAG: hypothetical protein NT118_14620 [Lentisphaerae bacterium]|nr:hypothetical protein [Lentisphaerota bacterium]
MKLLEETKNYFNKITGKPLDIFPVREAVCKRFPRFFLDLYDFHEAIFLNQAFILALVSKNNESTPAQLDKHRELIRETAGKETVFVFQREAMAAYNRNRMIHHGIAFIIPGWQIFMPFLMIELKEFGMAKINRAVPVEKLSIAAQTLILYHLQKKGLDDLTFAELSGLFSFDKMTVFNAMSELQELKLCETGLKSRNKTFHFNVQGRVLWEKALPYLKNPIWHSHQVKLTRAPDAMFFRSGMTALAHYSMIADNDYETYAVSQKTWKAVTANWALTEIPNPEKDSLSIEVWRGNPAILAEEGIVDRLSTYLIFKEDADERVHASIDKILEDVKW